MNNPKSPIYNICKTNQKTFPWPLLWLILLFVIPLSGASFLYLFRENIPFKIIPYGQLLSPPILAESIGFIPVKETRGKWQLVFLCQSNNRMECELQYDLLKRIHLSLGKDQNRVHLSYPPLDLSEELTKAFISYTSAHFLEDKLAEDKHLKDLVGKNRVLLIDPLGFLMMHYAFPIQKPKGLLEDLRRLLKFSHVG